MSARRTSMADRQAVILRRLTALLVGLALATPLIDEGRDALARPGGGQTFKSSPSPSPRSSPSPSPRSSPSPSPRSSPSPSPRSSPSPSPYRSSPSPGGYIPVPVSGSSDYDSGSSSYDAPSRPSSSFSLCKTVAILLLLALIVYAIYSFQQGRSSEWSTGPSGPPPYDPERDRQNAERAESISRGFALLLQLDPLFSRVLLEDFLYALYAEVQRRRGGGRVAQLAAYLSPGAQASCGPAVDEVRDIVVGALTFERVYAHPGERVRLTLRFISNYTEVRGGQAQAYYAEEVWTLSREATTPSRKPDSARVIGCPSCGGPLDHALQGVCRYCNARVTGEQELDWFVDDIAVEQKEAREPMLTGTVEEEGTDLPTRHDPMLQHNAAALQQRDPAFAWPALSARVATIFAAFHESWTAQDLTAVRPFLSDNLFEAQTYWVAAYKKQGLRNVSERPELRGQEVCKVESDGHYDLVTVRVWAQNFDYTVDASGQVVAGRRDAPRQYTEYWTLIRGKGAHGTPKAERVCPSCGAPATQVNMAGQCQHCGNKVTNGQFDWVLSRIEQDEVYNG